MFQFRSEENTPWPRSNSNLPAKHRPPPTALPEPQCAVRAMACAIVRRCPRPKPNAQSVRPRGKENIKPVRHHRLRKWSASLLAMTGGTPGLPHTQTPVGNHLVTMVLDVTARTVTHRIFLIRALLSVQEQRPTQRLVVPSSKPIRPRPSTKISTGVHQPGKMRHLGSRRRTIAKPVAPAPSRATANAVLSSRGTPGLHRPQLEHPTDPPPRPRPGAGLSHRSTCPAACGFRNA